MYTHVRLAGLGHLRPRPAVDENRYGHGDGCHHAQRCKHLKNGTKSQKCVSGSKWLHYERKLLSRLWVLTLHDLMVISVRCCRGVKREIRRKTCVEQNGNWFAGRWNSNDRKLMLWIVDRVILYYFPGRPPRRRHAGPYHAARPFPGHANFSRGLDTRPT